MKIEICDLKDLNLYVTKFVKELRDELIIYKLNVKISNININPKYC